MFAITQEHLSFAGGIIGVITFVKVMVGSIDNKIEKKLDKIVYEEHKRAFENWSNEKDRIIEEKISKIENSFKSDLQEIKESLKEINQHMLNCRKN